RIVLADDILVKAFAIKVFGALLIMFFTLSFVWHVQKVLGLLFMMKSDLKYDTDLEGKLMQKPLRVFSILASQFLLGDFVSSISRAFSFDLVNLSIGESGVLKSPTINVWGLMLKSSF
ncbi:hypothetical protein STEG23_032492, partial [Scotinomys teguina]